MTWLIVKCVVVRCFRIVRQHSCIRKGEMVGSPLHKVGQGIWCPLSWGMTHPLLSDGLFPKHLISTSNWLLTHSLTHSLTSLSLLLTHPATNSLSITNNTFVTPIRNNTPQPLDCTHTHKMLMTIHWQLASHHRCTIDHITRYYTPTNTFNHSIRLHTRIRTSHFA